MREYGFVLAMNTVLAKEVDGGGVDLDGLRRLGLVQQLYIGVEFGNWVGGRA